MFAPGDRRAPRGHITELDPVQPDSAAGRSTTVYRILVADDNAVNLKVGLLQLRQLGYRADAVNDGIEVLDAVERQSYDLILMDCHMPRMDGYQATRELRSRHRDRPRIPVIAMTANALLGNRERCLAAGMDDYINKPVNCDALGKLLDKWLASPPVHEAAENGKLSETETLPTADMELTEMTAELVLIGEYVGAESVGEIVELFVEDAPKRVAAIEAAFRERDIDALETAAHALRGSCLYLKAAKLAALCNAIEASCGMRELVAVSLIDQMREQTRFAILKVGEAHAGYISAMKR